MIKSKRARAWLSLPLCSVGLVSAEGSGRCSLFSRQHIHTFDGVIYEFPGDCSYMLAGDCQHRSFSILGKSSHTHKHCFSSIKQAMAKFVHSQDEKMPALCACLRLGDSSHGKRKGVTLFLGEFFELHLSVDGTLSQGAERYKWKISYSK